MSVLPLVVLIGFLGAVSGLKCYFGTQDMKGTTTCNEDEDACMTMTSTWTGTLTAFLCSTNKICQTKLQGVVKKCCYTDLCNNSVNIPLSNNSVDIPFSNILMILTMSLSVMLPYIM